MENKKLLAILRAFKALFNALPSEAPDAKYISAYQQLHESYAEMLHTLLATQHFAFCHDPDDEGVSIFSTETQRDAFIKAMDEMYKELNAEFDVDPNETVCKPMTFAEFIVYAKGTECDLKNYFFEEDGAIEFEPNNRQRKDGLYDNT